MSKNNKIILTPDRGYRVEGFNGSGQTLYPGMVVQIDPTVTAQGNRSSWKIYDRDADGDHPAGPFIVLTEDILSGGTMTTQYPTGTSARLFGFVPLSGCELNLLYLNLAGTADDHAAGEIGMVDDGTGKIIVTTGSPETEVCMLMEAVTDPTADFLGWCIWSGH